MRQLSRQLLGQRGFPGAQTIVLVPSINLGTLTSKYLVGLHYFEERNLYYLAWLKNPHCHFVVVVSEGGDPEFINYCKKYVMLVCGVEASIFGERFAVVTLPTDGGTPLARALLDNPDALHRLEKELSARPPAILDFWVVTPDEIELASYLSLPHLGQPKGAIGMDTKSRSRELFHQAGIPFAAGAGPVNSFLEARSAIQNLCKISRASHFLIKIEGEEAGNGIATVDRTQVLEDAEAFVEAIRISKPHIPKRSFEEQLAIQGAVVEELIVARQVRSPSVMMEILPDGAVHNLATHDQVLDGLAYAGAQFPAAEEYRQILIEYGYRVARLAAADGARGLVSVDFLSTRDSDDENWEVWGIEVNMRKGATTHPYCWTECLAQAAYDEGTGLFNARTGNIVYRSSEYFSVPSLDEVPPGELLRAVVQSDVGYCASRQSGVFVHMISCLGGFGKLGATVIGHDLSEVDHYWAKFKELLSQLSCGRSVGAS